jgi:branched-subunit amino acid aminotransferase/4-amino-4-deoxychorismate lyase
MANFQLYAIEDAGPRVLPVPDDAVQFIDLYRGLPLGVYDALRTFEHHKFLYLNRHLARTERSMALLGWTYRLDRARLLRALHAVVTAAAWPEMRVRLDILAGPAEALGTTSRELIALQLFTPPLPELYERAWPWRPLGWLRAPQVKICRLARRRRRRAWQIEERVSWQQAVNSQP